LLQRVWSWNITTPIWIIISLRLTLANKPLLTVELWAGGNVQEAPSQQVATVRYAGFMVLKSGQTHTSIRLIQANVIISSLYITLQKKVGNLRAMILQSLSLRQMVFAPLVCFPCIEPTTMAPPVE